MQTRTERPLAETTEETIGAKLSHLNFEISGSNVGHLEKVFPNVRQKLSRPQRSGVFDIDINAMIW